MARRKDNLPREDFSFLHAFGVLKVYNLNGFLPTQFTLSFFFTNSLLIINYRRRPQLLKNKIDKDSFYMVDIT